MARIFYLLIFILATSWLTAQTDVVQKVHTIKISLIGVGYAYEQPVSEKFVFNFDFMLARRTSNEIDISQYDFVTANVRIEPRYYYNFSKRIEKGKSVVNNSANYFSLSADFQLLPKFIPDNTTMPTFGLSPKWGLKRAVGKHFNFEFATGPGANFSNESECDIFLAIDCKLGFSFKLCQ